MRPGSLLLIVSLLVVPAIAQERPSSQVVQQDRERAAAVVKAAMNTAVQGLYDDISLMQLTPNITVGRYLKIMEKEREFMGELYHADQIGAPRWVDNYTCQVQLEIATPPVARALVRMAAANPRTTPVSALQIERASARWPRQFIATGNATSDKVIRFRPGENATWRAVSDAARQKALADAKFAATRQAITSVSPVLLSDSKTLGDSFNIREVGSAVDSWLANRPVTRVDFRDDLQVEVSLGVDERDFFNVVRNALQRQKQIKVPPMESNDWKRIEDDFAARFAPPVGRASAGRVAVAPAPVRLKLPARAPQWVTEQILVEGSATGAGPKLKTRSDAERNAAAKLQARSRPCPCGTRRWVKRPSRTRALRRRSPRRSARPASTNRPITAMEP